MSDHDTVVRLAAGSGVPVINGLSDLAHPAQALADCGQYKSYRRRTDGAAWRERLREVFLG